MLPLRKHRFRPRISLSAIARKAGLLKRDRASTPLAERDWEAELARFRAVRSKLLDDTALHTAPPGMEGVTP